MTVVDEETQVDLPDLDQPVACRYGVEDDQPPVCGNPAVWRLALVHNIPGTVCGSIPVCTTCRRRDEATDQSWRDHGHPILCATHLAPVQSRFTRL